MKRLKDFPERNELVIGTVARVNPYSAFITLEEYENKEAMIHISEVARKWVTDIRGFLKEGQKIVAVVINIDREKNHVTLSLKRVNKHDADEKLKEYKREIKAEKMLNLVAKELKIDLEKAYKEIGFKLQEEFGEMFKAFQLSQTPQGYDLLLKRGIDEKYAKVIREVAEKQMEIKEAYIKGSLEVKCPSQNGIEIIKESITDASKKYGLEIKYISAPRYSIYIKTKDAKLGEKKLKEAAELIINNIEKSGGQGSFKID
jgi:translation initiation factor 2 subunit 1